ncbi:YhdH/YhfP family quinone oxidoreductase [Desulfogranum japonicum]|uniref:YhdH/YhfP family quinone oxidoreductase n=1 Tax=Desulfogranum japonicum TaxID=231447 RepID=UPI00042905D1|nr:YhdH/YhfP family quinone oxidoreductase [Desulfogranum japonicum]
MINPSFYAFVVRETPQQTFTRSIEKRFLDDLPAGEVLIRVIYSSLNYKDALSASGNKGVTRSYPHTPGIDAAGIVVQSEVSEYSPGQKVICTGYDLGMNTDGGYGQFIRVPASWVLPLPQDLSLQESMVIGTAGFTAAQCVYALTTQGVTPDMGPVIVSGATGGVGTFSVQLLSQLGYEVHALSGKQGYADTLRSLGACQIHSRETGLEGKDKLLLKERWAGAVDTVGGDILANIIKACRYDGVVTACGNAFSGDLPLNVYPFILRGVHLIGIYSANCPMKKRKMIWEKLSSEWRLDNLEIITSKIEIDKLDSTIDQMLAGQTFGRTVVQIQEEQ